MPQKAAKEKKESLTQLEKATIDVLLERPGGDLFFQPMTVSAEEANKLLETKNPFVREHNKRQAEEKGLLQEQGKKRGKK
jgi:hypothetical protein